MELAWASLRYGDFAATEAQLASAERLSPDDPRLWAERGAIYAFWGEWMPGQYAQAEAAYRRCLELAPNVAAYHVALGVTLSRQGEWDEAIVELKRAVALDATDSVAYRHLADLHRAVGQESEAAWAQRQAERWERETATE
jgi:Flp pilus assembly protein TadD